MHFSKLWQKQKEYKVYEKSALHQQKNAIKSWTNSIQSHYQLLFTQLSRWIFIQLHTSFSAHCNRYIAAKNTSFQSSILEFCTLQTMSPTRIEPWYKAKTQMDPFFHTYFCCLSFSQSLLLFSHIAILLHFSFQKNTMNIFVLKECEKECNVLNHVAI